MGDDERVNALREHLERATRVLDGEREALVNTQSFSDLGRVFWLLARAEVLSATLHKRLVAWHTAFPEKPSLADSDEFWAGLKDLRAVKEELITALAAIRERERKHPTLRGQIEHATTEVGDVEHYFSSYLDRVNER
jgi:hypothetical protein